MRDLSDVDPQDNYIICYSPIDGSIYTSRHKYFVHITSTEDQERREIPSGLTRADIFLCRFVQPIDSAEPDLGSAPDRVARCYA